ncbi:hypothetical protein RSAG8_04787, partial [Rhizoctonia solani AG-8 WAC10335]
MLDHLAVYAQVTPALFPFQVCHVIDCHFRQPNFMITIRSASIRKLVPSAAGLRSFTLVARSVQARSLHVTNVLYKKNRTTQGEDNADSLEDQGDLFASPSEVQAETKQNFSTAEATKSMGKLEARR